MLIILVYIIVTIPIWSTMAVNPVCIVGGGVAGLRAAKLLQDKGHNVSLFEAKSHFGGKMETFRNEDESVIMEKGPIIFYPGQSRFRSLIKQYGLTENLASPKYGNRSVFDPVTGVVRKLPSLMAEKLKEFQTANQKYVELHANLSHLFAKEYSHPDFEKSDLAKSSLDWLVDNGLSPLIPFMYRMTTAGYGSLEQTAALYMLRYMNPNFYDLSRPYLESQSRTTVEGFDVLVERMASSLKFKYLDSELEEIDRSASNKGKVTLHFKGKQEKVQECSKVILAFPPLLTTLIHIIDDLSYEELQILGEIKVTKFTSAGLRIEEWKDRDDVIYSGVLDSEKDLITSPLGRGEVVAFIRSSKGTRNDSFMAYSWIQGEFDSGPTEKEMNLMDRKLKDFLKRIGGSEGKEYYHTQGYDYFPRVSGNSIENGFYQKFKSLQGKGGVYYATSLLSFESVDPVLEMVEEFVKEYF